MCSLLLLLALTVVLINKNIFKIPVAPRISDSVMPENAPKGKNFFISIINFSHSITEKITRRNWPLIRCRNYARGSCMRFDICFWLLHPCLEKLTGKADDFLSPLPPPRPVNNANTGTLATSSFSFGWCSATTVRLWVILMAAVSWYSRGIVWIS